MSTVSLRNSTRTALRFRVPARSVYLRPGDTFELPEGHLVSEEVKLLVRDGALVKVTPPKGAIVTATPTTGVTPAVVDAAAIASTEPAAEATSSASAEAASQPDTAETQSGKKGKSGRPQ